MTIVHRRLTIGDKLWAMDHEPWPGEPLLTVYTQAFGYFLKNMAIRKNFLFLLQIPQS